ncbi:MAG: hypothetical protein FD174_1415 [Geobacteraceae bacterium]|nr:MAG: hypothetical protein FD174_1415 [Geobacteraceae bacterium]
MIERAFLESLKGLHQYEVIVGIGDYYMEKYPKLTLGDQYKFGIEVMAILVDCGSRFGLNLGHPNMSGGKQEFVNSVNSFIQTKINEYRQRIYKEGITVKGQKYGEMLFGPDSLSTSEIEEIQDLLLKLRKVISDSPDIAENVKPKILRNIEDIEKEIHGVTIDCHKLMGLLIPLWALTKEVKEGYEILIIIIQIAAHGIENQTGIPLKQITQKLLGN